MMQIRKDVWMQILLHLKGELPREGVGVLIQREEDIFYRKLKNHASDETHFRVSPREWVSLFHSLEFSQERLVAIVHSHPHSPPQPSQEDSNQFFYSDVYMLIVSFMNPNHPEPRMYKKNGDSFANVSIELI